MGVTGRRKAYRRMGTAEHTQWIARASVGRSGRQRKERWALLSERTKRAARAQRSRLGSTSAGGSEDVAPVAMPTSRPRSRCELRAALGARRTLQSVA